MRGSRRLLHAIALASVAVALSACGDGAYSLDPLTAAVEKSANAGGVHVDLTTTMKASTLSGTMTATGAFAQDEGELIFDLGALFSAAGAPPGESAMKVIFVTEGSRPIVYMQIPFLDGQLPNNKSWLKLDLQRVGKAAGVDFRSLLGQNQSPAQTLDMLRAAGEVEEVGQETIDGDQVTHYRATVDLEQALEQQGAGQSVVQRLLDLGAPTKLPFDVWIGEDDGLIRQVRTSYASKPAGESVSTVMTMKLSDWGTDVSIQAPPADDVVDVTSPAD